MNGLIFIAESIIIIKNFGIQLRIKYFFGAEKNRFLETDTINGIFIHEYIFGSEVKYSVAFLVKGQTEILLLFKHLYPGSFDILRRVCFQCKLNLRWRLESSFTNEIYRPSIAKILQ